MADLITIETNTRFQAELKSIPGTTEALADIHKLFGSENVALMTTSRSDRMDISLAHATDPISNENARLDECFQKVRNVAVAMDIRISMMRVLELWDGIRVNQLL